MIKNIAFIRCCTLNVLLSNYMISTIFGYFVKTKIKMQIILISILSFIAAIQASNIVEIQVKTSNELNADMTFGHLDLVICGDPQCCLIENLDSKYDDFQLDSLDSFTHGDLQGCDQFNLPNDYNGKKYFSNTSKMKNLSISKLQM